jgi:hypothetical protein
MFFFLLVSIEDGSVFQENKNLEYHFLFFPGGRKFGWGVVLVCGRKHFLDQVFKPHILGNNEYIWAFFFFIGKYFS